MSYQDLSYKELEVRMRPGKLSQSGFLGPDESLEKIINEDDLTVKKLGITHELIADKIQFYIDMASKIFHDEFYLIDQAEIDEKYFVEIIHYMGYQECPWLDNFHTDFDVIMTKKNSAEKISLSGLAIHLIRDHKFYEGKSVRYRVDPEKIVKFLELQNTQEAIRYYDGILETDPKDTFGLYHKGLSLYHLAKYAQAIEFFDKALEMDNSHFTAWRDKGHCLYMLKKNIEALECYGKALEINPKSSEIFEYNANSLFLLKKYEEAVEFYNKVLEINPKDIMTLYKKGQSLFRIEKYKESLECLNKTLELDPNHIDAMRYKEIILQQNRI